MDLIEPGKPNAKRKMVPVKKGKRIEDAGEPLPTRILRSTSKKLALASLGLGVLPAVETKKPKTKAGSTSRKPNATVTDSKDNAVDKETKKTAKPTSSTRIEFSEPKNTKKAKKPAAVSKPTTKTATGTNANASSKDNTPAWKSTDESMQGRNNPMLLDPVIRCIFLFLDIEDVKKFRFVSRAWSSVGKKALSSRALILFNNGVDRGPIDFPSCFLDPDSRFSSFEFHGGSWMVEELSKFFDEQQKNIKQLTFNVGNLVKDKTLVKNFDIGPWISKSPIVKSNVKYLTKLAIHKVDCAIPLHLLKHIKDLSLAYCRIKFEAGIKIHPVKLFLHGIDFYQDETLPSIKINDIVNFSFAKEIHLNGYFPETDRTEFSIDVSGNCRLKNLTLLYVEIVNLETSNWNIRQMRLDDVSLKFPATKMTIYELYLSSVDFAELDLFTLPQSIEKLGIDRVRVKSSRLTMLKNLKYLSVEVRSETDFAYLTHFWNCPQLTHLKFCRFGGHIREIKFSMIPKSVKTLTLDRCFIDWVFGVANVQKIVFFNVEIDFEKICKFKISVNDIIMIWDESKERTIVKNVANFFECRKRFGFCKRFFIGKFKWDEMKFEGSVLNEHVDVKSPFYVFKNGEKGRALDEKSFYQLADIPKHIVAKYYEF